jgi:cyclopropane-fatty-acyl-phospholipid synthase
VPGVIARNPSLGMAEAFMDGSLTIKGGDIMEFVGFVRRNNP